MQNSSANLKTSGTDATLRLTSEGDWIIATVAPMERHLKSLLTSRLPEQIVWDFSRAGIFDSAGMMLVIEFEERFKKRGCCVRLEGMHPGQANIYRLLRENITTKRPPRHAIH